MKTDCMDLPRKHSKNGDLDKPLDKSKTVLAKTCKFCKQHFVSEEGMKKHLESKEHIERKKKFWKQFNSHGGGNSFRKENSKTDLKNNSEDRKNPEYFFKLLKETESELDDHKTSPQAKKKNIEKQRDLVNSSPDKKDNSEEIKKIQEKINEVSKRFACKHCMVSYPTEIELNKHKNSQNSKCFNVNEEKKVISFSSQEELRKLIKSRNPEKPVHERENSKKRKIEDSSEVDKVNELKRKSMKVSFFLTTSFSKTCPIFVIHSFID